MSSVYDFIMSALPWIAIGLLLAVFFAKNKRNKQEEYSDFGTEGLCLGMAAGSAVSIISPLSVGLGMTYGMLIGLIIGSMIKKK